MDSTLENIKNYIDAEYEKSKNINLISYDLQVQTVLYDELVKLQNNYIKIKNDLCKLQNNITDVINCLISTQSKKSSDMAPQITIKLEKFKFIRENKKSILKKTESLLKNYNNFKIAIVNNPDGTIKTKKMIKFIDKALETLEDDPYYSIIEMRYFEHKSISEIAEFFDVEDRTIARNKKRILNELKAILFSDDVIEELFL